MQQILVIDLANVCTAHQLPINWLTRDSSSSGWSHACGECLQNSHSNVILQRSQIQRNMQNFLLRQDNTYKLIESVGKILLKKIQNITHCFNRQSQQEQHLLVHHKTLQILYRSNPTQAIQYYATISSTIQDLELRCQSIYKQRYDLLNTLKMVGLLLGRATTERSPAEHPLPQAACKVNLIQCIDKEKVQLHADELHRNVNKLIHAYSKIATIHGILRQSNKNYCQSELRAQRLEEELHTAQVRLRELSVRLRELSDQLKNSQTTKDYLTLRLIKVQETDIIDIKKQLWQAQSSNHTMEARMQDEQVEYHRTLANMSERLQATQSSFKGVTHEKQCLQVEITTIINQNKELKEENKNLTNQLEKLKKDFGELESRSCLDIDQLESKNKKLCDQIETLKTQITMLQQNIRDLNTKRLQLEKTVQNKLEIEKNITSNLLQIRDKTKKQLDEANGKRKEQQTLNDQLRKRLAQSDASAHEQKAKLEHLTLKLHSTEKKKQEYEGHVANLQLELSKLKETDRTRSFLFEPEQRKQTYETRKYQPPQQLLSHRLSKKNIHEIAEQKPTAKKGTDTDTTLKSAYKSTAPHVPYVQINDTAVTPNSRRNSFGELSKKRQEPQKRNP